MNARLANATKREAKRLLVTISRLALTDKDILGVLQQILRLLVAGVDRDKLYLLDVYDDAVVAEKNVPGWSGP